MDVYLDLIIAENFIMNFLILYTTGTLLRKKTKKYRLMIGSFLGTIYVFSLCIQIPSSVLNISKFLIGALMVKVAINDRISALVKETAVYLFVSFIYAGCALGFVHIVKPKVLYIVNGIIIGGEYIFELVVISAIVSFLLIKLMMQLIKISHKFSKRDMICEMELFLNEKSIKINALLDSGNLLQDSASKNPVIVVYKERARALFDNILLERIDSLIGGDAIPDDYVFDSRIKVIPYQSVGTVSGLMVTYKIDKVKLEYQNEIYEIKDALIGLYNEAFSKNDKYSALVGLQIFEGSKLKNEFIKNAKSKSKYSVCKIH